MKRKKPPLQGIEPRLFSLQSITIPLELSQLKDYTITTKVLKFKNKSQ
jgi:hypothetical protein